MQSSRIEGVLVMYGEDNFLTREKFAFRRLILSRQKKSRSNLNGIGYNKNDVRLRCSSAPLHLQERARFAVRPARLAGLLSLVPWVLLQERLWERLVFWLQVF